MVHVLQLTPFRLQLHLCTLELIINFPYKNYDLEIVKFSSKTIQVV